MFRQQKRVDHRPIPHVVVMKVSAGKRIIRIQPSPENFLEFVLDARALKCAVEYPPILAEKNDISTDDLFHLTEDGRIEDIAGF